jgi:hypothetical protein
MKVIVHDHFNPKLVKHIHNKITPMVLPSNTTSFNLEVSLLMNPHAPRKTRPVQRLFISLPLNATYTLLIIFLPFSFNVIQYPNSQN